MLTLWIGARPSLVLHSSRFRIQTTSTMIPLPRRAAMRRTTRPSDPLFLHLHPPLLCTMTMEDLFAAAAAGALAAVAVRVGATQKRPLTSPCRRPACRPCRRLLLLLLRLPPSSPNQRPRRRRCRNECFQRPKSTRPQRKTRIMRCAKKRRHSCKTS